jgi:hypothetical protein
MAAFEPYRPSPRLLTLADFLLSGHASLQALQTKAHDAIALGALQN